MASSSGSSAPSSGSAVDPPVDWGWLRAEIRQASDDFESQLRTLADDHGSVDSIRVPNLEWTVRDLAAHLVSLPAFYQDLNRAIEPFEMPASWPDYSRSVRAHLDDQDTATLADRLGPETDRLLDALGDDGAKPWRLYLGTTVANVGAGYLGELLMHGQDLAALTGDAVEITTEQGHAIVAAMMTLAPAFVDRDAALKCPGVYHLRFRGAETVRDFTYWVAAGRLTVTEGRPDRADARLVADPAAFALVAMGRMSQARAGLTGRIMAFGRKPWRLVALGRVRVDGI